MIKLQEVIISDESTRGKGVEGDPFRRVIQIWDKDGSMIAENDPFQLPVKETTEIFRWLLGISEGFPDKKEGDGAYYWRKHLRAQLESIGIRL